MKLLIKFPTRQRPEQFKEALDTYYRLMSNKHQYQFIISMDQDDPSMLNSEISQWLKSKPNLLFNYGNNKTKVQAINADISQFTGLPGGNYDFDILLLASDDMIPLVHGYDDIIVTKMQEHFSDMSGCLHFNDGRQGRRLNTLSIMGVELYKHFGYIYHPSYESMYCDNEFMDITEQIGKAVYIDDIIISHQWINICGGKKDELYQRNDRPVMKDKRNYQARKAAGFPK